MYLSASNLAVRMGLDDLARIAGARIKSTVQTDVLEAALAGLSLDAFVDEMAQKALLAKQRIDLALASSDALINSYVSGRYPDGLTQDVIESSPLPQIAVYLVKHDLMVATDEETRLNHKMAMSQLKDISTGASSLGSSDPKKTTSTIMRTARSHSQFGWDRFGL